MHKLTVSLILMILIAILGVGWGLDQLFERYIRNDAPDDALSAYQIIGLNLAQTLDQIENPDRFIVQWPKQSNASATLGKIDSLPLPAELTGEFMRGEPLVLASEKDISIHFYLPLKQKVLSLTLPPALQNHTEANIRLGFTLFFYIGIIGFAFLWLYPLIRRLLILSETAKAFGHGDLHQRIKTSNTSYISDIENEFNRMAQQIESLVKDNKLLGNAVSHDLRTPLARLRFGIDSLSETGDPKIRKKYQMHMSHDIAEMESLVEILLRYARLDHSMIEIKKQHVNLTELLKICIESAHSNHKNIQQMKIEEDCFVSGDERYLTMLINNLLSNAIQYSNQQIAISLSKSKKQNCLVFEDDGPGIPASQRELVLKPFMRGENANQQKGYGMGLAIVSRIAEWHGATIYIEHSTDYGGARIRIQFPMA